MDGFSGTTLAPEKGYEICHVECQGVDGRMGLEWILGRLAGGV
jgi:hypothetical protein